jgi:nucleotide-binding universal stress UspA family protein
MRILLAIDDSKFSEAAVETVIEQRRPHSTEVRVLHVVEAPPLLVARELGGYEPALQNAMEFQKQHAEALVEKTAELLRARGLKVTAALDVGDPKSKILDVAEEWHADLIVLGSHGRKGLNRFLMGGVSEAVARHACCSVEIVRICPANVMNQKQAPVGGHTS